MTIWGASLGTQYPDISNTTVDGKPAKELVDDSWYRKISFLPFNSEARAIIKARGSSARRSAASAAIDHMQIGFTAHPTVTGSAWLSLAMGSYGIEEGIIYSFPVTCKNGEYELSKDWKSTSSAASGWTPR